MSLGLVCFFLDPLTHENLTPSRQLGMKAWQQGKYTEKAIYDLYLDNIRIKSAAIDLCVKNRVKFYRMTSGILPLWEKIEHSVERKQQVVQAFKQLGDKIRAHDIRVNFHSDHFCLLGTDSEQVFEKSVVELENHVFYLESMELEESVKYNINIHAGGKGKAQQAIDNINKLSPRIRNRLTLENDEFCYSVIDLYNIYTETGVPIVFDSHHHQFNDGGLSGEDALLLALDTWRDTGVKPTTHISNSRPELTLADSVTKRRAHADYVTEVPEYQLLALKANECDAEIEAKKKSLAYFQVREQYELD